jgi:hypothetical protein
LCHHQQRGKRDNQRAANLHGLPQVGLRHRNIRNSAAEMCSRGEVRGVRCASIRLNCAAQHQAYPIGTPLNLHIRSSFRAAVPKFGQIARRNIDLRHNAVAPASRIVYQAHAFGARPFAPKRILTP